jgi:Zn-dependent protease with chaperone function
MWYARRSRTWWLGVWAGAVAVAAVAALVVPWVFDPLFYRFRPLEEVRPDLVPALEAVANRTGLRIPAERIFMMEASVKTRTVNAYLTGYGPSKRIVLWDTTLNTLSPPQIQTVFAHEAGHYVLLHVPKSLALFAVAMLAAMYVLRRYLGPTAGDVESVARSLLFFSILGFATEPAVNAYSRMQEHQADIFELEAMHGILPAAGINSAEVDVIMADLNLEHPRPGPFVRWWLYDHPPSAERIRFALGYAPWNTGSAPRYIY